MSRLGFGLLILGFGTGLARGEAPAGDYKAGIEAWRQKREERLKADGGWLTVAGLHWLKDGSNRFGTASDNEVVLPEGSAPAHAGVFELSGDQIKLRLEPGVDAKIGDQAAPAEAPMQPDSAGEPTVLALGPRLRMHVIKRGERYGIRLKDFESPLRKAFTGLQWFPVDESWRIEARFDAYKTPRTVDIPNILGEVEPMSSPGTVAFTHGGREFRLEPVVEDPNDPQLFFIFWDQTAGKETYGSGRFLYAEMPKDGKVVLDFNKAYSPPCAFTPYATCPLPPPQNRMQTRIEAGEKFAGHGPEHAPVH